MRSARYTVAKMGIREPRPRGRTESSGAGRIRSGAAPRRTLPGARAVAALLCLTALAAVSCGPQDGFEAQDARQDSIRRAERIEVVAPAGLDLTRLESLAAQLERRGRWSVSFSRGRAKDGGAAHIWIADASFPGIGEVAQRNGIVFEGLGAFWYDGERYSAPGDGVLLTLPDPDRDEWPLQVYLAPRAEHAAALVSSLEPRARRGWVAWRAGRISRQAEGDPRGVVADLAVRARLRDLRSELARVEVEGDVTWELHGEFDAQALAGYRGKLREVRRRVEGWCGAPPSSGASTDSMANSGAAPLRVHLWSRIEDLAAVTGAWEFSARGVRSGEVHALLSGAELHDFGAGFARNLATLALGEPREAWVLDAVGVLASGVWFGAPLESALRSASGGEPTLESVLAPAHRASPHSYQPLRALALSLALEGEPTAAFAEAWRTGRVAELVNRARFEARVRELAKSAREHLESARTARAAERTAAEALRGVHLLAAPDPDRSRGNGYGSQACNEALTALAGLGANAVVLAPIAWEVDDLARPRLVANSGPFDGATSDAALWLTMRAARAAGLRVVLAPQLWSSSSGGLAAFPLRFSTPQESAEILSQLRASVEHYARLAELGGAEAYCFADRTVRAARAGVSEPVVSSWSDVVAAARGSFSGALTYQAVLDGEAQSFKLWEQLDAVALALSQDVTNSFFEFGRPNDAGAESLLHSHVQLARRVAQQHSKPLWLMRAGFAPTTEAWRDPRAAQGSYDTSEQERLLLAFGRALERLHASGEAPEAVFLWNWTTDADHGNAVDRSFTLQNRPAAAVAPKLLERP